MLGQQRIWDWQSGLQGVEFHGFRFDINRISINSNSVNLIEYKNVFLIFVGTALAAVRQ